MVRHSLRAIPEGMVDVTAPHGCYFFPGAHPEEEVAYGVVADALSGVFGR